jgi:hypothetical protein
MPQLRRVATLLATSLLALLLAGCSILRWPPGGPPDPVRPQVSVTADGQIVVNQEPIVVNVSRGAPPPIVFSLPEGQGLKFLGNGVDIEGEIVSVQPAVTQANPPTAAPSRDGKPPAFITQLNRQQTAIQCKRDSDVRVVCTVNGGRPGASFLYTVRVERNGVPLPPLDPVIRML